MHWITWYFFLFRKPINVCASLSVKKYMLGVIGCYTKNMTNKREIQSLSDLFFNIKTEIYFKESL